MSGTMKAVICNAFGPIEQLAVESVPTPVPKADEILIKIEAAGVNFPDGLLVQGLYQMKPQHPFIPGNEVAGTVIQIGDNVPHLQPGRRVVGLSTLGGYAEYVCCKATHVMPLPDAVDFASAAGLITAHATAHHGLKQRAQLQPGQTVLVTGAAGGTGIAAVQIAKKMGATVIAACSSDEKVAFAKAHGADFGINYSQEDVTAAAKSMTNKRGVDVIYECVGGDIFTQCSKAMAWNGRLLVVGFASGQIPQFPVNLALVKGYSVVGVFWGAFTQHEPLIFAQNMKELFGWLLSGDVSVHVDQTYSLEQAVDALLNLNQRSVKGKLVLTP